ncbi:DNA-binding MurR/RpiR family transcriptional regulator [Sulfitobacter undariae]|uniref:DNA-binding MurR/RpiR family transcriptional regulator n=1 Tax=Sulfitobacter undariae TaxID=1563671 RepID=A0A7W6GZP1_9RHOB|nr:MurR/RpiR family transcriptional regulator [Sulfitobacter undariae]MBB3992793.1 DNA-binding MurR/RpiR family transcriptional regulator [Sulfitobacter undariae]
MTQAGKPIEGTVLERVAQARNLSKSESAVAMWIEAELMQVPFDTAGELAKHANVGEMTVTRFVRQLGYKNFKEFKVAINSDLRTAREKDDDLRQLRIAIPVTTQDELAQQLELELAAIVEVYRLATTDQWHAAIDVVMQARHIKVCGFQGSMGLAMDFATRLKYARSGVRYTSGISGNWSEIFADDVEDSCVILVDTVPYAAASVRIAQLCLDRGIPLITVTDRYDPWPRQYTPHALSVSTVTKTFLDSTAGLSALLNLILNGVTARSGDGAVTRVKEMSTLGQHFEAYTFDPGTQSRPTTRTKRKSRS